jgi:protein O-mannosyl-transferase
MPGSTCAAGGHNSGWDSVNRKRHVHFSLSGNGEPEVAPTADPVVVAAATDPVAGFLRSGWNQGWLFALLLVAATFLAYQPVWRAGFVWDDDRFLTGNPLIKASDGLYRFWCTSEAPDYFPMTSTTLWLEWRLWGEHALGYHLVNVLLHAMSALVWWRILGLLKLPGARIAALIFALHPVNVESVAWITERKNTLAMFFYAWTLLWYLRFEDTGLRRYYWLGAGAFALALLSKTAVVPLPLVLLGLAAWRRGRVDRRDLGRSLLFFGIAALLGGITVWFQYHSNIGPAVVRADSFWARLAGAGWAVWFYLYKALWPLNLIFVYPKWQVDPTNALAYAPVILLVAVFVLCWLYRRSWGRAIGFGLGYFVVMLLPILGFLDIYFMRFSLVADHWQYFALMGPIVLVAAGAAMTLQGVAKGRAWLVATEYGAILLVLGLLTWRQSASYQDLETLWQASLRGNPNSFMVHNNLGLARLQQGQTDQAIAHFQKALSLESGFADAHNNLGLALLQRGQADEAIAQFQAALKSQPARAELHNNLAVAFLRRGQASEAASQLRMALQGQPDYLDARYNLGMALGASGLIEEAITELQKVVESQPGNAQAWDRLGGFLLRQGRPDEAVLRYQQALIFEPGNAVVLNNLAWILSTCPRASIRNGEKAVELARQAEQFSGGRNPSVLETLAAAYAELGRYPEALATATRALELAAAQTNRAETKSLQAQIELYRAGIPFRDSSLTNATSHPSER